MLWGKTTTKTKAITHFSTGKVSNPLYRFTHCYLFTCLRLEVVHLLLRSNAVLRLESASTIEISFISHFVLRNGLRVRSGRLDKYRTGP